MMYMYLFCENLFFVACFCLIALSQVIGAHGTDVSFEIRLLNGETLLQAKNFTGHKWDSNPGPCMMSVNSYLWDILGYRK